MSRVVGIDLGAYSVKVVVANPGLRKPMVTEVFERRVPEGDEPHLERAARVAGELVREQGLGGEAIYAAVAGDQIFLHVLEFPFKSLRRADLERAVGAELEGILPIDLDDMVFAFEPIPRDVAAAPEPLPAVADEDPTFVGGRSHPAVAGQVAAPASGLRVFAAAMMRSRAAEMLRVLGAAGVSPRGLIAAPASYMRVAERTVAADAAEGTVAVIDVGHLRSDICVMYRGRPVYARTISGGGLALTTAIAREWNLGPGEAEAAKHQDGFIGSASEPAGSANWQRIHEVLSGELLPLARDLRRTLSACRAKTGATVDRVLVVGGSARLRGFAAFLTGELQLPVQAITPEDNLEILSGAASGAYADVAALAAGVCFEGAGGRPAFDLRQGPLAYKSDLGFLRVAAPKLAAACLTIVAFALVSGYARLHKLRHAERVLDERVLLEATAALGEPHTADEVLAEIGPADTAGAVSPIPEMSAYDLLLAFNEVLPQKTEVTLDVKELEIGPGKLVMKASSSPTAEASALQGIKKLEEALKASKCFKEFASPESQPGANDSRDFTLTIQTKC